VLCGLIHNDSKNSQRKRQEFSQPLLSFPKGRFRHLLRIVRCINEPKKYLLKGRLILREGGHYSKATAFPATNKIFAVLAGGKGSGDVESGRGRRVSGAWRVR
jgi:hypothetical protein